MGLATYQVATYQVDGLMAVEGAATTKNRLTICKKSHESFCEQGQIIFGGICTCPHNQVIHNSECVCAEGYTRDPNNQCINCSAGYVLDQ